MTPLLHYRTLKQEDESIISPPVLDCTFLSSLMNTAKMKGLATLNRIRTWTINGGKCQKVFYLMH